LRKKQKIKLVVLITAIVGSVGMYPFSLMPSNELNRFAGFSEFIILLSVILIWIGYFECRSSELYLRILNKIEGIENK
jgi:hypothetical protein